MLAGLGWIRILVDFLAPVHPPKGEEREGGSVSKGTMLKKNCSTY